MKLESDEKENYTYQPKIMQSSKNYIENRNINSDRNSMWERLHKDKENKKKQRDNSLDIKKTDTNTVNSGYKTKTVQTEFTKVSTGIGPKVTTSRDADNIVNKLYQDAINKKKRNESKEKKKEVVSTLVTNESKQVILEKIFKDFETSMLTLLDKKLGDNIDFTDFCKVLNGIGFTNYDSYEENENDKKKHAEATLLHEAWKLITKNSHTYDVVDSWGIFVFCFTVLGIYDGDENDETSILLTQTGRQPIKKTTFQSNILGLSNIASEDHLNPIEESKKEVSVVYDLEDDKNDKNDRNERNNIENNIDRKIDNIDNEYDLINYLGSDRDLPMNNKNNVNEKANNINVNAYNNDNLEINSYRERKQSYSKSNTTKENTKSTPGLFLKNTNSNFDEDNIHAPPKSDPRVKSDNRINFSVDKKLNKVATIVSVSVNTKALKSQKESNLLNNITSPKSIDSHRDYNIDNNSNKNLAHTDDFQKSADSFSKFHNIICY